MPDTEYESKCDVSCTDSGVLQKAEVHKFKPNDYLEIVIQGVVVALHYNGHNLYVGSKFGMEFTSYGPKKYTINRR